MFITPGPPEVYKFKNGSIATLISNGPSGQENAILSINHDYPCTYFEISIWINRFGMTCVGGGSFEAVEKPQPSLRKALGVVWHSMGSALCVIAYGDVSFIKISWMNKGTMAPILFSEATTIYDGGAASPPLPNVGDQIAVKLLRKITHSVEATAICQGDNGRYLFISSNRRVIYKFTWFGVKISEISTDIHHEVFRSWELGSLFSFTKAQCQVYGSKSNETSLCNLTAPSLDRREETDRPQRKVSDTSLLAEDCSVSESERIISCGYCSALQIHYFIRGDGSLSFLQDLGSACEQSVKPRTSLTSGYRCTGLIHLFTLINPDLAGVDQKTLHRSSNGVNGSHRINAENVPNGGRQPAVSRVTHVCVIKGEDAAEFSSIPGAEFFEDNSALFVMTVLTCHLPSHGPNGECDRYKGQSHYQHPSRSRSRSSSSSSVNGNGNGKVEQRATLSLIAVRARVTVQCHGESEQSDVLKMDQVSSVILEVSSGSVNPSQSNAVYDGSGVIGGTLSERAHSLVTLRRFGHVSQLVLVTVRGVISCRPVGCLTSELFRIDTNSYSSGVRHAISSMTSSLGRLLIAVTRVSDAHDAVCMESWSQVHVIPLLESAESSVFHKPCGDVLVDGVEQRLLAFKMLWNQDPGSVGPEGPGYFREVSLPDGLIQEWKARVRYLSMQSARGKSVSGSVLLVASSSLESSGVCTGRNMLSDGGVRCVGPASASASAGKGYLAVVVAGRSALRGDPCLWVFNTLTRRWRSCDITKGKVEGEGDKMPFSTTPTERSMETGSGLWVDVDMKPGHSTHLSGDVLLHRQYSTDSEISNSSKVEYRRATSISQHPSPSGNSSSSSSAAPNLAISETTSIILGISWFGDHSLILLRRKDTAPSAGSPRAATSLSLSQPCFTLEILSRAPTKESMRSGRPRPAVHRVVPLSLAVPPSLSPDVSQGDFSPRLFEVRHCGSERRDGSGVTERCTVVLSNGWYCVGYSVETLDSNSTDLEAAADYRVSLMWDISLSDRGLEGSGSPLKSLSLLDRNGESSNASMPLPISAISILPSTAGEGPSLLVLDANGAAWRVRPSGCDVVARGPFTAMTSLNSDSLFNSDHENYSKEETIELPSHSTPISLESAVILHGTSRSGNSGNAMSGDCLWMSLSSDVDTIVPEGDSPFLAMPLERTHTDSTLGSRPAPLSMTVGIIKGCLITLHRTLECLPLSSASSSYSGMRDLLLTEASGVAVSKVSLGFNLFLALLEILSGRKSRAGVLMSNGSVCKSDANHAALVGVMRRFLGTIQSPMHSPITLRLFVECLELHIKHLLESSTFFTPQKNNRWVRLNAPINLPNTSNSSNRTDAFVTGREKYCEIMSALYYCSPPASSVFCELISRLGRKLEPSLSRRLFPVPLDPRLFTIPIHTLLVPHPRTAPSSEAVLSSQGADADIAEVHPRSLSHPSALSLAQHPSPASSPSPGPSPLSVFEHALSTRQLNRSCRLLTLACEDVGGTDSPASASLCLRMVLELLYECLRHLSMPLAVQCFDFCRRMEVMVRMQDL
jgi:hypothetical protein